MEENIKPREVLPTFGGKFVKALSGFQKDCPAIVYDASVKYGNTQFEYATLPNIIKTVAPALAKNGLAFSQLIFGDELHTVVMHESGEFIRSFIHLPKSSDLKIIGSNLTYLKRYSLCSILGVSGYEDKDAIISKPDTKADEMETLYKRLALHISKSKTEAELEKCLPSLKSLAGKYPNLDKEYFKKASSFNVTA